MTANKWYCIAQSSTFDSSCGITIYSEGVAVSFTASVRFGSSSINIASCAIDGDILLSVRLRETDNKWCIDLLCNTEFNPTIDITDSPYWEVQNTPAGTGSILAIINDISKEFNTGIKGGESLWQLFNFGTQEKPEYAVVPKDYDGKPIGVVSKTFISFGGHNSGAGESGGTGGGGITTFDVYVGNDGPYSLVNGRVNLPAYPTANLTGYATENWVKEQGYLTQHQDISHLLGKEEAKDIYATIIALNEVSDRVETIESIIGIDSKGNVYIKKKADGTARDFYTYGAISFGGNGQSSGSGEVIGSSVQYNASVTSGKLLGTLVIDGVDNKIYAPAIPTKLSAFTNDEGYVTEDWVNNQGFLTAHQSLTHLLSKTEAANTYQLKGNYVTENTLNGKGYLTQLDAEDTYQPKGNYATIQALNGATTRIETLESTLETEQGYIDTLQGYFTSGKANKAIADGNGNNIVDTYATKVALKDVADKVASLQDMWFFDEAHANTIRTLYNVVVDKAISFGGYGESSGSGGGITNITYDMVIDALGFIPYNSSNPKGYITSSALSGYATQSWVTKNYQPKGDYLTPTTGVTLSTDQTITGIKTFSNGLKIGSAAITEKTKNSTKYVEIDSNLVVTGAISFGGFGEGGSTGGGITTVTKDMVISALGYTPYNAANPNGYITSSALNGYATTSWVNSGFYSAEVSRFANTVLAAPNGYDGSATFRKLASADIPNLDWSKITSGKPTTLSGYGITDAYTKTAADSAFLGLNTLGIDADGVTNLNQVGYGYATGGWYGSGPALAFGSTNGYTALIQQGTSTHTLYVSYKSNSGDIQNWKTIAFTDSNVASAKKLAYNSSTVGLEVNSSGNVVIQGSHFYSTVMHTSDIGTATMPFRAIYTRYVDTYSGYDLRFRTGGTEQMRIAANSGCVILGDSNASENSAYKLDVRGVVRAMNSSDGSGVIIANQGNTIDGYYNGWGNLYLNYTSSGNVNLAVGGGNVGIGTTSPAYKLDVKGNIRFNAVTIWGQGFDGTGNVSGALSLNTSKLYWQLDSNNYYISCPTHSGGAMLEYKAYSGHSFLGGNVAIGTTPSTSYKLYVSGSQYTSGNIVTTGSITFGSASDRRLKDNIKSMTDKQAVAVLSALNPVTFNWNSTAYELGKLSGISDGFIADEFEKLIPNSGRDIWANYRAINYERATGYLVKGWQKHQSEIERLKDRVKELENELKQYRRA